jgi:hypothetical protein
VPTEREDLPTMDDVCYGKGYCEPCQEYNWPHACPCGEPSTYESEER